MSTAPLVPTSQSGVQWFLTNAKIPAAYDPNDPLAPVYANLVATYANTAQFKDNTHRSNATLIEACLRARSILIWKNTPGDCPVTTKISIGPGNKIASGIGMAGTTAASLGLAGLGPGALVALPFAVWGIISAHHAAAVQKEQATLCDVGGYVNDSFAAIVAANIDWATKKQNFNMVATQAIGAAQGITQKGAGTCNAGCMYGQAILALRDLFIMLYAQPPTAAPIQPAVISQVGGPTPVNSQGGSTPGFDGTSVAEVAGLGLGAHFLGAF